MLLPTREGEGLKKWKAKAKASSVPFFSIMAKKIYLLWQFFILIWEIIFSQMAKVIILKLLFLVRFGDFRMYIKIWHHNNIKIAIADRKYFWHNKKRGFFGAGVVLVYLSMVDFMYIFSGLFPSSFTFQSVIF